LLHFSKGPIVLQKSAAPRSIAIRRVELLNQNSLFGLDLEKVFFAPELKIVLQDYQPGTDSCTAKEEPRKA
jgi:hypothetical protein